MQDAKIPSYLLRFSDLNTRKANEFKIDATEEICENLAEELDVLSIKKLRFSGQVIAQGKNKWVLNAKIGASVEQKCVVTLQPVRIRIDDTVRRVFVPDENITSIENDDTDTIALDLDETLEPLDEFVDLNAVLTESLALLLPDYPRAQDAQIETNVFTESGKKPMTDEDTRPFAGLAELRNKLKKEE